MNKCCTFFGHRNCPSNIKKVLLNVLLDLVKNKNINCFLVGSEGNFDHFLESLKELKILYPNISYSVIKAYLPIKKNTDQPEENYLNTLYPEELSFVPKKYAIARRNMWMLKNSQFVVTYVTHESGGGASNFKLIAFKQGKNIIELSDLLLLD